MKYILLLFSSFLLISFNQEFKLQGTYKVEYKNYFQNDGYVDFSENSFNWRSFRLPPYQGEIEYTKNAIYLKNKSNYIYKIDNENVENDTIIFFIYDLNGKGNYLDIAIGQGKFIKAN